ncbi:ribonuclease domain-containing protein [Actinokineospora sp. UTMC 2448]|uniref:ribonuclease domain-containing protein n=1 Tax=Actinokineospora sp. UTMC 2448 TaxID=2268449 RepID=UPI0021647F82|nr:ribonuclease domain-containing protein [Actinokineospora sp. UTMC 2448]UVS77698.1 Guanyl-specific ribonuclease St [Actinokineospora sp. UTMC 2448]
MGSRRRITLALVALVALVVGGWLVRDLSTGADTPAPESGLPVVALSALPAEAAETWELIRRGGPFPYPDRDGSTFGNREGLLPERERGYYKEYTVPTPGSPDRGARRLVTGSAEELYYTDDHYESFVSVDTAR